MKSTLIVMMGVSGCGKSTLANKIVESHDDCVVVSRDQIRFGLLNDEEDYFAHEDEVLKNYYSSINSMLKTHRYVIADATHISRKSRRSLFSNINLDNIEVIGVWIDVPLEVALKQNEARSGRARVQEHVIKNMYKFKVSPHDDEPFDKIIFINPEQDLAIGTNESGFQRIVERLKNI